MRASFVREVCALTLLLAISCGESFEDSENRHKAEVLAQKEAREAAMSPEERAFVAERRACGRRVHAAWFAAQREELLEYSQRRKENPVSNRAEAAKFWRDFRESMDRRWQIAQEYCAAEAECWGPVGWWQYEREFANCLNSSGITTGEAISPGNSLLDGLKSDWPGNTGADPWTEGEQ